MSAMPVVVPEVSRRVIPMKDSRRISSWPSRGSASGRFREVGARVGAFSGMTDRMVWDCGPVHYSGLQRRGARVHLPEGPRRPQARAVGNVRRRCRALVGSGAVCPSYRR